MTKQETFNPSNYKIWLVEKGNPFNTFKATIIAKETFTKNEIKEDMFNEFNVKGNIKDFRISIERIGK